jgi:hypothetical protein
MITMSFDEVGERMRKVRPSELSQQTVHLPAMLDLFVSGQLGT